MSEQIQRWRGIVALIAGGLAAIVLLANLAHSGKIVWAGVVILVIAFAAWRSTRRSPA
jgi:hypothetical protein